MRDRKEKFDEKKKNVTKVLMLREKLKKKY